MSTPAPQETSEMYRVKRCGMVFSLMNKKKWGMNTLHKKVPECYDSRCENTLIHKKDERYTSWYDKESAYYKTGYVLVGRVSGRLTAEVSRWDRARTL